MRKNFWLGTLAAALLISLAWGYNQYRVGQNFQLVSENENRRAFHDLASHLDQLENDLAKGGVATTANQKVLYLTQGAGRSDAAMKDFAQLPAEQVGLSYVGQFLVQTGDFTRNLAQRIATGGSVAAQDDKVLNDMHERLLMVNRRVQELLVRVDTEQLVWTNRPATIWQRIGLAKPPLAEAAAEGTDGPAPSVNTGLEQLDASLQKLPPFTYTGEFASRTVTEPLGLPPGEVNREQAQAVARDFLGKTGFSNPAPEFGGETQGPLGGYQWKAADTFVEVSKRGGVVTIYRNSRVIQPRSLNPDDAKGKAMAVLKALGLDLVLTSTEDFGSYLQLEAVSEKDGIRFYPDKVRMMVAMDNGQLIGLDATPYWSFHRNRSLNRSQVLSEDSVRRKLRSNFQVKESRLALIPKTGNQEVLSYEFRGNYQGEDYLLYLNAFNGSEEKILRIIQTPRGEYLQ